MILQAAGINVRQLLQSMPFKTKNVCAGTIACHTIQASELTEQDLQTGKFILHITSVKALLIRILRLINN